MTAAHVVDGCSATPDGAIYVLFPEYDFAFTFDREAAPEINFSCEAPVVGEGLRFYGFAGTRKNGDPIDFFRVGVEEDEGTTLRPREETTLITVPPYIVRVKDLAVAKMNHVRGGYSGGLVISDDGHFRGIISSTIDDEVSFVPANVICGILLGEL